MPVQKVSPLNFINETRSKIRSSRFLSILFLILIILVSGGIIYYLSTFFSLDLLKRRELREGMVGQPRYLNPLFTSENEADNLICNLVFNSLIKYDFEKKEFVGDLAESFEVQEEGKVYLFTLKDDVYFHDGQKLTIEDVLFTYEVAQHPNYHGTWKEAFATVQIEKLSDREIKMTLEKPLASFLEYNSLGIIPKHLFEDVDDVLRPDNTFNVSPIGSNKFKYFNKEIRQDGDLKKVVSFILESVDEKTALKRIKLIFFNSETELMDSYKMGKIDSFGTLDFSVKQNLDAWQNYDLVSQTLNQRYYGLFFNLKSSKKVNEFELRKALSLGLDKQKIWNEVFPGEEITEMMGPLEKSSWAYKEELNSSEFNQEEALTALESYSEEELSFGLTYPYNEVNNRLAENIKSQWAEIGVTIELKPIAVYELRDKVVGPRNYDILLLGQEVSLDPDRYAFWHSTNVNYPGLNISQIEDRFIDRALELGRTKYEQTERIENYDNFQRYFHQELPAIMLYQPKYFYFVKSRFADKINIGEIGTPQDRFDFLMK